MNYLNKNIEEIGKRKSEKSLIDRSESWKIFKSYNSENSSLDNFKQGHESY